MKYFQLFRIDGTANAIKYDDGLKSSETEKKRLTKIMLQSNAQSATDDNDVQGYHERAKVFEFPEKLVPTQVSTSTTQVLAAQSWLDIPVDLDIPVGESFKVALKCAATATKLRGVYEYEMIA